MWASKKKTLKSGYFTVTDLSGVRRVADIGHRHAAYCNSNDLK